jgi:DNA helicase II / ATP-dependent DNA helicase PcrA
MTQPRTNDTSASLTLASRSRPGDAPVSLEHVNALLRGLNREQRRAVTHRAGPQLVLAGPGTGKTEVVTRRIAWLIATKRAQPREILALTFTDKAATEMQARVDVLVPYGRAEAAIHTFHAFGDRLLREHAFELGLPGDVRLLGRTELVVLLREQMFGLGLRRYVPLGDPTRFLAALVDLFQRAKDEDVAPRDLQAHAESLIARSQHVAEPERAALLDLAESQVELAAAYDRYVALLAERGVIDHGDQVALALRLLRHRPAVAGQVRDRFRYLLVDEFQDTNPAQLELVMALTGRQRDVTVVGDDDQAIYAFRGAAISNMRRFAACHPDLKRVVLRRNYRSRGPIIAASQRLIRHNGGARLADMDGLAVEPVANRRARQPAPVQQLVFGTRAEEADGVAEQISRRVRAGENARSFAVLVRSNAEADDVMRSLVVRGVPVQATPKADLYRRPEVRPLLAFLRVLADPAADMELYAVATSEPYGLGGADLTALLGAARRRHVPLWQVLEETGTGARSVGPVVSSDTRRRVVRLVEDVRSAIEMSHQRPAGEVLYDHLRRSGILRRLARAEAGSVEESRLRNVARFFEIIRAQARLLTEDRVASLVPHLATLAETSDEPADTGPDPVDAVSVLTVHRAKGLEFDVVFLCGLADGRFPSRGRPPVLALPDELRADPPIAEDALAEERRLCYVAMTRARDELWLSRSSERGRGLARPSPFVAEALDSPPLSPSVETSPEERIRASVSQPGAAPATVPPAVPAPAALSLSYSQVDDYLTCPERYRLRHVIGVPTPPHHALTYGSALHQAVAAFHLRQAKGEVMSEADLMAAFARGWSPEGFLSRAHEEARYTFGQAALRRFRAAQLSSGNPAPVAIERPFSFRLGRDIIRGRMDRLDETPDGAVITDYKSSDVRDQRKADEKARDSLQLQVYALAHQEATGQVPAAVQLHFLDSGVVGSAVPTEARLERARAKLGAVADGIRGADFPARPSAVTCGYCPYRQICPSSAA